MSKLFFVFILLFSRLGSLLGAEYDVVAARVIHMDNLPKHSFSMVEDADFNIQLSTLKGVFSYNRNAVEEIDWFINKSEVLRIARTQKAIFYLHLDFNFSVYSEGQYRYLPASSIIGSDLVNRKQIIDLVGSGDSLYIFTNNGDSYLKYLFTVAPKPIIGQVSVQNTYDNYLHIEKINQPGCKKVALDNILQIEKQFNCKFFKRTKNYLIFKNETKFLLNRVNTYLLQNFNFNGSVNEFIEDYEGNVWVATASDGVYFIDNQFVAPVLSRIYNDSYYKFTQVSDSFYFSKKHGFFKLRDNYFYDSSRVFRTSKGNTAVMGYNGFYFNKSSYSISGKIFAYDLSDEYILLSTDEGLWCYKVADRQLFLLNKNVASDIVFDENKNVFFYSYKNIIYQVDKSLKISTQYKHYSNIQALFVSKDDFIFSTINGVYTLQQDSLSKMVSNLTGINNIYRSRGVLYLADKVSIYKVYENEFLPRPLLHLVNKSIYPKDKSIAIEVRLKSHYDKNAKYIYKLYRNNKAVSEFHYLSNSANFNNLDIGEYRLEVYGVNELGVNSNKLNILFTIYGMFYETLFFKVVMVIFSILIFFIIIYRYIKHKNKENMTKLVAIENENYNLRLLKSQMSPHFIFNSLNALKGIVYFKQNEKALEYIDNLSVFFRNSLKTDKELITFLQEELNMVSNYVELENIRVENKISLKRDISEPLKKISMPSNILQALVENAIIHGFDSDNQLVIAISAKEFNSHYEVYVVNNGKPLEGEKMNTRVSFALQSIEKRLKSFNLSKVLKGIEIRNLPGNFGVECIIRIKK